MHLIENRSQLTQTIQRASFTIKVIYYAVKKGARLKTTCHRYMLFARESCSVEENKSIATHRDVLFARQSCSIGENMSIARGKQV